VSNYYISLINAAGEHLFIGGGLTETPDSFFVTSDGSEIRNPNIAGFDKSIYIKQTVNREDGERLVSFMAVNRRIEPVAVFDWDKFDHNTGILSFKDKSFAALNYQVDSPDRVMDEAEMTKIILDANPKYTIKYTRHKLFAAVLKN
jgi:hypothetical protein